EGTQEGYDPEDPNTPGKVSDEDEADAKYAGLIIEKTSDKEEVTEAGEEITYTFEVTNNGKVTLENVKVNDPMLAELDIEVELEKSTLEPGESTTGTPPRNDPEYTAFPYEPAVSPPSEENVPSKQDAKISLEKVADIDEYTKVGDEVKYTFTVKNTGNVTLNDVKVNDETFKLDIS